MRLKKVRKKRDGTQELVFDCPLCGSKKNMEVNPQKGVYLCWACNSKGSLKGSPLEALVGTLPVALDATPSHPSGMTPPIVPPSDLPPSVLAEVRRRRVSEERFRAYRPSWDGNRICFPAGSGWFRRAIWPWVAEKVLTDGPKDGVLGGHLLRPGAHVVVTEGDWKAISIPEPWVGIGVGGKFLTEAQADVILASRPASITLALDGGEDEAVSVMAQALSPHPVHVARLPWGKGPDDIPRPRLVALLLPASNPQEGPQNAPGSIRTH